MSNESKCPGHNRAECVSCCWPKADLVWGENIGLSADDVRSLHGSHYTAVDMTTAAAQGFRDGVESKKEALMFAAESLAKITSGDGSGHADLAFRTLALAGYKADEAKNLVDAWKKERSWR